MSRKTCGSRSMPVSFFRVWFLWWPE
jgi:hypothetical protein